MEWFQKNSLGKTLQLLKFYAEINKNITQQCEAHNMDIVQSIFQKD